MLGEFYQFVDQIGLNTTKIFVAIGVLSFVMVFSIREIFAWFLKTSDISKQFAVISNRLEKIESKLDHVSQSIDFESELPKASSPNKNQFEIHH